MEHVRISAVALAVLRIVALSYVGLSLLVFFTQGSYVYYPTTQVGLDPGYFNLTFEPVSMTTSDQEAITGWYVPAPAPPSRTGRVWTVLFCHGNAGNMGDRGDSICTFHRLGMNVMIFDYRGYGDSSGKPTEEGTYLDVEAAWRYLRDDRGIAADDIVLFGRSLGGAVASWLAAKVDAAALVLESTFASAPAMAAGMFPFLPTTFICRFKYDTLGRIADVGCPVLVAHGPDDESIPFEQGRQIFDRAREPKCFITLRGGHNAGGLDADPVYQQRLVDFLAAQRSVRQPDT